MRAASHQAARSQQTAWSAQATLRRRIGFALVEAGLRLVVAGPPRS
jgi:hypothetical protein